MTLVRSQGGAFIDPSVLGHMDETAKAFARHIGAYVLNISEPYHQWQLKWSIHLKADKRNRPYETRNVRVYAFRSGDHRFLYNTKLYETFEEVVPLFEAEMKQLAPLREVLADLEPKGELKPFLAR